MLEDSSEAWLARFETTTSANGRGLKGREMSEYAFLIGLLAVVGLGIVIQLVWRTFGKRVLRSLTQRWKGRS